MDDRGNKNKQTQGYKKLKQYTEDLLRNQLFLKKLWEFNDIWDKEWTDEKGGRYPHQHIQRLIDGGNELSDIAREVHEQWELLRKLKVLAYEYGVDFHLIMEMLAGLKGKKEAELLESYDFCDIGDNYKEYIDLDSHANFIELDYERYSHGHAYPVRIDIHKFASKRDVLDFVEKRWDSIQKILKDKELKTQVRFRQRNQSRELLDFIWEGHIKGKKMKAIKKEADEKFPKNGLTYYEIGKLIRDEMDRRYRRFYRGSLR